MNAGHVGLDCTHRAEIQTTLKVNQLFTKIDQLLRV